MDAPAVLPDKEELSKALPLSGIRHISLLKSGFQNTIYKIETGAGVYCLRINQRKNKEHVAFEVAVLSRLRDLPVPQLVGDEKKGYIFDIRGRPATLYPFIIGEHVTEVSGEMILQVGQFLGAYHSRCDGFSWEGERFEFYHLPQSVRDHYVGVVTQAKVPYLEMLPRVIEDLLDNQLGRGLPKGPIHVDLSPRNSLFSNGRLVGVLDFDNAFIGPFVLDLGKTMMFFAFHKGTFDAEKARHLYKAYIQKRSLTDTEYGQVYKALKFAFLSHVFVDYYMYAIGVTSREYFEYIVRDLYQSYKNFDMSEHSFFSLLER